MIEEQSACNEPPPASARRREEERRRRSSSRRHGHRAQSSRGRDGGKQKEADQGFDALPIEGDRQQRVTMVAPKTLKALQARARFLFGSGVGHLRFYHHGAVPINGPEDFAHVQAGDLVVATLGDKELEGAFSKAKKRPPGFAYMESTTKNDYRAYTPTTPQSARASPQPVSLPGSKVKFEANSCYRGDFVEKPYSKRPQWPNPTGKTRVIVPDTGLAIESHYRREFVERELVPAKPIPQPAPALQIFKGHMALSEETTQTREFAFRKGEQPHLVVRKTNLQIGNHSFEGTSSYAVDYKRKSQAELSRGPKWATRVCAAYHVDAPFESDTEYKQQFQGVALEQPVVMHLEPAKHMATMTG
eukprot:TRINITY_DN81155_c0_g1_i1.p1 TRINITY_DN81155_c0_g1~~TRINITY_DN81155_c0_g1_i1.p1  ORF type:complete len:360 (-),score=79.88 TRINITY_DN81155_c0_g1_i1:167-1246(-)